MKWLRYCILRLFRQYYIENIRRKSETWPENLTIYMAKFTWSKECWNPSSPIVADWLSKTRRPLVISRKSSFVGPVQNRGLTKNCQPPRSWLLTAKRSWKQPKFAARLVACGSSHAPSRFFPPFATCSCIFMQNKKLSSTLECEGALWSSSPFRSPPSFYYSVHLFLGDDLTLLVEVPKMFPLNQWEATIWFIWLWHKSQLHTFTQRSEGTDDREGDGGRIYGWLCCGVFRGPLPWRVDFSGTRTAVSSQWSWTLPPSLPDSSQGLQTAAWAGIRSRDVHWKQSSFLKTTVTQIDMPL